MREIILYSWLQTCIGTASRLASEILPRFSGIDELYQNEDFSFLGAEREKYIERLENKDTGQAFEIAKRVRAVGAHVVGYYDKNYPSRLRGIPRSARRALCYRRTEGAFLRAVYRRGGNA